MPHPPESSKCFLFDFNQEEQRVIAAKEARRVRPFEAHSQTTPTRHPSFLSLRIDCWSSQRLRSIFFRQNLFRVFGHLNRWQSCPCQKQP
jgi:hypothetical protein